MDFYLQKLNNKTRNLRKIAKNVFVRLVYSNWGINFHSCYSSTKASGYLARDSAAVLVASQRDWLYVEAGSITSSVLVPFLVT